jgi:tetratricopeptide (TPR) repeat protein
VRTLRLLLLVSSLSLVPADLWSQAHEHAAPQPAAMRAAVTPPPAAPSIALFDNLGAHGRPLGNVTAAAQRWFDQGLRLTWAFGHGEAVQSFTMGIAADSTCAMCWWGVAWASGPYLNDPASDSTRLAAAHVAIRRAQELAASARPADRALIDAMATRYAPVPDPARRRALDTAYALAMAAVAARFPNDDEVQTLLGEARLILAGWDDLYTRDRRPLPRAAATLAPLETVLARNLRHPGACHLYIHATEAGPEPGKSEACADQLADMMPGASHMLHMPSHVYHRIGRWGDAVRANQRAIIADQHGRAGGVPGVYPSHNVAMLTGGAVMDGQRAVAIDALQRLARAAPSEEAMVMVALARFGRWTEIRAMRPRTDTPVTTAMSAAAFGLALLDAAEAGPARRQLELIEATLEAAGRAPPPVITGRDAWAIRFAAQDRYTIAIARGVLAGELLAARGQVDSAVTALEGAVAGEDSLEYEEHDRWLLPPRHVLAGVLLDAGRAPDAERVLRADLAKRPRNGWALRGLQQALAAQGKVADAARVQREFAAAWARSDTWLPGPRFRPGGPVASRSP